MNYISRRVFYIYIIFFFGVISDVTGKCGTNLLEEKVGSG